MNVLDIVLLALIALSGLLSLRAGLIREIFALGALLVGIFAAVLLTRALAGSLPDLLKSRVLTQIVFFLAVFLAVQILVSLIGTFASHLVRAGHLGWADRLLGFAFGCLRGAIVALLIVIGLSFVLPGDHPLLARSRVLPWACAPIEVFSGLLPDDAREALQQRMETLRGCAEQTRAREAERQARPALGTGVAL